MRQTEDPCNEVNNKINYKRATTHTTCKNSGKGKCMISTIRKRNGALASYDNFKIANAIYKAAQAAGSNDFGQSLELSKRVEVLVNERYHPKSIPAVEEIQDLVEKVLMDAGLTKIAKIYILYREQHRRNREVNNLLVDINRTMDGYLRKEDWRVKENANVGYSLGGLILHNSGAITANYWLENIYSPSVAEAHRNGDFHIHDLSMFSGYCAGWSLRQLIMEGLGGVPNKITSGPAKHLSTLVQQMVNFLGVLQNEWAGAQAFSSFDTYLAPFVKVGNLTHTEVKQCIQSFVFGVNTPSRWGSQAPFTNITFDWIVPEDMREQPAIVGGELQEFTYAECQDEMDLINRTFLEVLIEGDYEGRGFAYPYQHITSPPILTGTPPMLIYFSKSQVNTVPLIFRILSIQRSNRAMYVLCAAGYNWIKESCVTAVAGSLVLMSLPVLWV
jgi:ribonucleoside-triphosphate reductase (formate)